MLGCALGLLCAVEGYATLSHAEEEVFTYKDANGVRHFTNVPADRRYRSFAAPRDGMTILRFRQDRRAAQAADKPGKASPALKALIHATAVRFNLETALVHAVVRAESGFDPQAVSPAGARGLMQLMPGTAREVGVRDVFHPRQNLEGGAAYLRGLLDRYDGDVQLALAAYNAGPTMVEEHEGIPPFPETREYLKRVFRYRQEFLHERLREVQRSSAAAADQVASR